MHIEGHYITSHLESEFEVLRSFLEAKENGVGCSNLCTITKTSPIILIYGSD
jgi:hypothetical protein